MNKENYLFGSVSVRRDLYLQLRTFIKRRVAEIEVGRNGFETPAYFFLYDSKNTIFLSYFTKR